MQQYTGTIKTTSNGTGVIESEEGPLFLTFPDSKQVLNGDEVLYTVAKQGDKSVPTLVKVLTRQSALIIGTTAYKNGNWVLQPDEICLIPIFLKQFEYCADGLVVAARIDPSYKGSRAHAHVERVIGQRQESASFLNEYYLAKFDFATRFSFEPLQQLKKAALKDNHAKHRQNESGLAYVTIDDESTSDMDDALFAACTENGYVLYVAISDVSNYVTQNSDLDKAAYRNATSVYLPGKLTPMLPPELSSQLCSLVPNEPRLAVTCQIALDKAGNVISSQIYRSTIQSRAKLSYSKVSEFFNDSTAISDPEITSNLVRLQKVYELLSKNRIASGYFEIEEEDVSIQFTNEGPRILSRERSVAHKLVEECMLIANNQAAKVMTRLPKGVFRHQAAPDNTACSDLSIWLADSSGIIVKPEELTLNKLVSLSKEVPACNLDEFLVKLKNAMNPAVYSTSSSEHFSLGFSNYTHFTSPIRRYADLLAHRLILGESVPGLAEKVMHCSEKAKNARMAEKGVIDYWVKTILGQSWSVNDQIFAQMINQSPKSIKVLIRNTRIFTYIGDASLKSAGYSWEDNKWIHPEKGCLRQGQVLSLYFKNVGVNKCTKSVQLLMEPVDSSQESPSVSPDAR